MLTLALSMRLGLFNGMLNASVTMAPLYSFARIDLDRF